MPKTKHQRNEHFSDRAVQGALLARLGAHWLIFMIAVSAFLYFVEMVAGDPRDAGRELLVRHAPTMLAVFALAPIFIYDLCKLSNRFAGPMVRLRQGMRDLAGGREVPPIHFRERDYWQELATDFNKVVERVRFAEAGTDDDPVFSAEADLRCESHPCDL